MATFEVTMNSGLTKQIRGDDALTAEQAMRKAEEQANEPIYVGEKRALERSAEDDSFTAKDGYLIRNKPARAVSARAMREVYMGGGYCLVPA